MTLTDDEGTAVTIKAEPQKIVSLTPAATEILFALGAGDRIVGKVEDFTPYPPEAAALPDVATFKGGRCREDRRPRGRPRHRRRQHFNPPGRDRPAPSSASRCSSCTRPTIDGVLDDIELIGAAVGRCAPRGD